MNTFTSHVNFIIYTIDFYYNTTNFTIFFTTIEFVIFLFVLIWSYYWYHFIINYWQYDISKVVNFFLSKSLYLQTYCYYWNWIDRCLRTILDSTILAKIYKYIYCFGSRSCNFNGIFLCFLVQMSAFFMFYWSHHV